MILYRKNRKLNQQLNVSPQEGNYLTNTYIPSQSQPNLLIKKKMWLKRRDCIFNLLTQGVR